MIPFEITVEEFNEWRKTNKPHVLTDVREPQEFQIANIGGRFVPIRTVPTLLNELDPEQDIVVHCHHGGRWIMAVEFLRRSGLPNALQLQDGLVQGSERIDP